MKRAEITTAIIAILFLAACNQTPAPPSAEPEPLPTLGTAPYAAHYAMNTGEGARTLRIFRSGAQQRIESSKPAKGKVGDDVTTVILANEATGKIVQFQIGPAAPPIARVVDRGQLGALAVAVDIDVKAAPPKILGKDTVANQDCEIWEIAPQASKSIMPPNPRQICITRDGIVLRVQVATQVQPELVATKVERGQQDATLFTAPDGYRVIDTSDCTAAMADALAAVKSGKKPDASAAAKCRGLAAQRADPLE